MIHKLKISPIYYEAIENGSKTYEIRKDDRNYQVGDVLELCEYEEMKYTGKKLYADILSVLRGTNCKDGYCIMSINVRGMSKIKGVPIILRENESKEQTNILLELEKLFYQNAEGVCGNDMITVEDAMNCVHKWLGLL